MMEIAQLAPELEKVPISSRGVSLHFLKELVEKYGKSNVYDLKKELVMPTTNSSKTSLAELWFKKISGGKNAFGDVTVFVSHAWVNRFGALVEALTFWESAKKSRQGVYYFFDILAVNQHEPTSDLASIRDLVAKANILLFVLSPLVKPVPISRVWCLFEIYAAIQHRTCIECVLPEEEREQFRYILSYAESSESLMKIKLNSENAEASLPADKDQIKKLIRQDIGFSGLDQQLHASLSNTLRQLALQELKVMRNSPLEYNFTANVSRLCEELEQKSVEYEVQISAQANEKSDEKWTTLQDEDNASESEEKKDCFQGLEVKEPVPEGRGRTPSLNETFVVQTDKSTCGALYALYLIITSRKFAALQFFWLLVCLSSFIFYALMQLYVAVENERDENHPEKLAYVTDYGDEDSSREFKMPYIYVSFWVDFDTVEYIPEGYDYDFDDYDYEIRMNIEEAANSIVDELYDHQDFNGTAFITYRKEDFDDEIFEEVEVGHLQFYW